MNDANLHQTICAICSQPKLLEELIGTCSDCRNKIANPGAEILADTTEKDLRAGELERAIEQVGLRYRGPSFNDLITAAESVVFAAARESIELRKQLALANLQLHFVDETLSRRPALADYKERLHKIEACCRINQQVTDALHQRTVDQVRIADLEKDKARLDKLQSLTESYRNGWVLRRSSTGRGMRLHETTQAFAMGNVREAIDLYNPKHPNQLPKEE